MEFVDLMIIFLQITVLSSEVILIFLPVGFRVRRVLEIVFVMLNINMDAILFCLLVADPPELLVVGRLAGSGMFAAKVLLVVMFAEFSAMSIGVSHAKNGLDNLDFLICFFVVGDSVLFSNNIRLHL